MILLDSMLNLPCVDGIGNSTIVSKSLNTSYQIIKLVQFLPKHDSHLPKIHKEEYDQNKDHCTSKFSTLILFSETCWTFRTSSLTWIYENYKELEDLWDWCLDKYKDEEAKAQIQEVQSQIQTSEIFLDCDLLLFSLCIMMIRVHHYRLQICVQWMLRKFQRKPLKLWKRWDVMRNLSSFGKTYKTKQPIYISITDECGMWNVSEEMLHQCLMNILFLTTGKFTMNLWIA